MELNSAALDNILAAYRHMKTLGRYPSSPDGRSIFSVFGNLQTLDAARSFYYGHDAASLAIFDWVAKFRIIEAVYGMEAAKWLPDSPFSREEWEALEERAGKMDTGALGDDYLLDRIDTWLLEAYSLKGLCETRAGDIVLDCGAYTGSTSLYFSGRVGPQGHVYGFEPVRSIYAKYEGNMRGVANVTPVNAAVAEKDGIMPMREFGAGSQIIPENYESCATERVYCLSIDSFMSKQGLDRVDFIKMDVEGAEESALKGAERTIKQHRPKLAISAYHREHDIIALPKIVNQLDGDYRFHLRHFSDCFFETVLFCVPQK